MGDAVVQAPRPRPSSLDRFGYVRDDEKRPVIALTAPPCNALRTASARSAMPELPKAKRPSATYSA